MKYKTIEKNNILKEEMKKVSEGMAKMANEANLIYFAVCGFFKLKDERLEPKLITYPIESEEREGYLHFRQTYMIDIEGQYYPVLATAEKTIMNIIEAMEIL